MGSTITMENQLSVEINGVKYIAFDRILSTKKDAESLKVKAEKLTAIWHGIIAIKRESFLHKGYAIVRILVPEEHALAFSNLDGL